MKIAILGVAGTFMAGIAHIAKQLGHQVTGYDLNIYPPMSTQLTSAGIEVIAGFETFESRQRPELVIVGNVIARGNPALERVLTDGIPYISGPQWLYENLLKNRTVLAVAGTHGKTTTTSLLTWVLTEANLKPGYLIGGVAKNFEYSGDVGEAPYFVIEADEYDTAFCDKRSKFLHYHPKILLLNNLEFDHADIFSDLYAIQQQCHHLIRTIPSHGLIIHPAKNAAIEGVLQMGCWTTRQTFSLQGHGGEWQAKLLSPDGQKFQVYRSGQLYAEAAWSLLGEHNVENALSVFAAATYLNLSAEQIAAACASFQGVKRRLECRGEINGITFYDDFAHHPTAIAKTLQGLRRHVGSARLIAVLEFGSFTMRTGHHLDAPIQALSEADLAFVMRPKTEITGIEHWLEKAPIPTTLAASESELLEAITQQMKPGDHVIVMSNTGFAQIQEKLMAAVEQ